MMMLLHYKFLDLAVVLLSMNMMVSEVGQLISQMEIMITKTLYKTLEFKMINFHLLKFLAVDVQQKLVVPHFTNMVTFKVGVLISPKDPLIWIK